MQYKQEVTLSQVPGNFFSCGGRRLLVQEMTAVRRVTLRCCFKRASHLSRSKIRAAGPSRTLDVAQTGERQLPLLSGEAGIGKSRVVQELKDQTSQDGATPIAISS